MDVEPPVVTSLGLWNRGDPRGELRGGIGPGLFEGADEVADFLEAGLPILLERLAQWLDHRSGEPLAQGSLEGWLLPDLQHHGVHRRLAAERYGAGEYLVADDAQRVDVGALIQLRSVTLLGLMYSGEPMIEPTRVRPSPGF